MRPEPARIGGRDPELTVLLRLAEATRDGRGRCAVVRGRRGLGKTAVLGELAARAAHFGDLVLMPKIKAGQSALCAVSELLKIPYVDTRSTNLHPVFRRLNERIAQLAEENAVCLLIDDLSTHDTATLRWLDFTLRRAEHLRLFVVAATVSTPATALEAPLTNLAVHPNCTVLDLEPPPPSHQPGIAITRALAEAKLGRAEEAQTLLDGVGRADAARRSPEFLYASAWTGIAREDWRAAVDDLFECGRVMTESGVHNPVVATWWADAAIVAMVRLEWREAAAEALEKGREMALRSWTPENTALVTMIEGLVTSCTRRLTEAAERFAELPACPWHPFAEFLLGRAHAMAGNNSAARAHLRNAIGLMLNRGQSQWVADAHRLLQQAGGRMRTRPATTYDVLSTSERRVLDLASSGATNREISGALYVSLRTVETHLTKVYRKLGISGRAQLRAAAGIAGPSL